MSEKVESDKKDERDNEIEPATSLEALAEIKKKDKQKNINYMIGVLLITIVILVLVLIGSLNNMQLENEKKKEEQEYAALLLEGDYQMTLMEYSKAEEKYLEAKTVNTDRPDAYLKLSAVYLLTKEYEQAKGALLSATKHASDTSVNRFRVDLLWRTYCSMSGSEYDEWTIADYMDEHAPDSEYDMIDLENTYLSESIDDIIFYNYYVEKDYLDGDLDEDYCAYIMEESEAIYVDLESGLVIEKSESGEMEVNNIRKLWMKYINYN